MSSSRSGVRYGPPKGETCLEDLWLVSQCAMAAFGRASSHLAIEVSVEATFMGLPDNEDLGQTINKD